MFDLNYFHRIIGELDLRWCAYPVQQDLRSQFRQCARRGIRNIGGFLFCRQHAKMVEQAEQKRRESQRISAALDVVERDLGPAGVRQGGREG